MNARPEVVLTNGDHNGTLAAVRSLGRAGVPVVVADQHLVFARALWSRHATRALLCPDAAADPDAFVDWLLALGASAPGRVLYPTSDDVAWLFARRRRALSRVFRMPIPSFETVLGLLDKWRLHESARRVGIDTPDAWLPNDDGDVARVAREVRYPAVIKPRTQALLAPHQKGRVARDPAELERLYADFRRATHCAPVVLDADPTLAMPMIQSFAEGARDSIYNLSGFVDRTGEVFVAAASRKRFQWPRTLGVGLCFEELEVLPELATKLAALCRDAGYHGAFEVEFLESAGRHLLIDFNPRFYGQMAFEIARGLDVPLYVYLDAIGARDELERAVARGRESLAGRSDRAYCDRIELELALRLLPLAGQFTDGDLAEWRAWLRGHDGVLSDAVWDRDDWAPGAIAAAAALVRRAAHPRSTWRAARG